MGSRAQARLLKEWRRLKYEVLRIDREEEPRSWNCIYRSPVERFETVE